MWHGLIPAIVSGFSLAGSVGSALLSSYLASCFFACGVRVEFPIKPFKIQQFANHLKVKWEGRGVAGCIPWRFAL